MATSQTGNFAASLTPETTSIAADEYNRRPKEYINFYNVENTNRNFDIFSQVVGLGPMPEKAEGTPVIFDRAIEGFSKTLTAISYGLGYRITREMRDDDLFGKVKNRAQGLGLSASDTEETIAADLFNNGFTTNTGGDSKPLFSTSHPNKDFSDGSNRLATDADLNPSSLKDAIVQFEDTTDQRGIPLLQNALKLVVASAGRYNATEILKSTLASGTANNDINSLKGIGLEPAMWRYLTDTDAWFLMGDIHMVKFLWRQRPQLDSAMDFDTGDAKFKITSRFVVGHSDWRGWFGVPGN